MRRLRAGESGRVKIAGNIADRALAMLEIDRDGYDQWDKRIIESLIHEVERMFWTDWLATAQWAKKPHDGGSKQPYLIRVHQTESRPR